VATTVAVRRPPESTAISPNTSPGPIVRTTAPSLTTSAVPEVITNAAKPKSPSSTSVAPSPTSSSSQTWAIEARWSSVMPAKSGMASIFAASTVRRYPRGDLASVNGR
jgi:hypothetical protein